MKRELQIVNWFKTGTFWEKVGDRKRKLDGYARKWESTIRTVDQQKVCGNLKFCSTQLCAGGELGGHHRVEWQCAADEMAAALEQLACSIAREFKFVQFASLLFSFSEYKYGQPLFHKEVKRTVASATSHKLKALVSQLVMAELALPP